MEIIKRIKFIQITGRAFILSVFFYNTGQVKAQTYTNAEQVFRFDTVLLYKDIVAKTPVNPFSTCVSVNNNAVYILYKQLSKLKRKNVVYSVYMTDVNTYKTKKFEIKIPEKSITWQYGKRDLDNMYVTEQDIFLSYQGLLCQWDRETKKVTSYTLPYETSYSITEADDKALYAAYAYNHTINSGKPKTSILKIDLHTKAVTHYDSCHLNNLQFCYFAPCKPFCTIKNYTIMAEPTMYQLHLYDANMKFTKDYNRVDSHWIFVDKARMDDLNKRIPAGNPQMWITNLQGDNFRKISKIYSLDKVNDTTLAVRYYHYMPDKDSLKPTFFIDIYSFKNGNLQPLKLNILDGQFPIQPRKFIHKADVEPWTWTGAILFGDNRFIKIKEWGVIPNYGDTWSNLTGKSREHLKANKPKMGIFIFKY